MVGIVLASHGEFANGIFQSGSMIFGNQTNVKPCVLMPDEGPKQILKKMKDAIASFENQEDILFLIDLWGGTPFNQAVTLLEGHETTRSIITGLNLPMLLEVYAARMSMQNAHEIAAHVKKLAQEGIQTLPNEDNGKRKENNIEVLNQEDSKKNLYMQFVLARIDTRLLHGQVATAWTKTVNPNRIIVVSDTVAHDSLRKRMIEQAAPPGVKANVVPIYKMIEVAKDSRFKETRALLLFETPQDALRTIQGGVDIKILNLGSMAHSQGKVACTQAVSMGKEDVETFGKLLRLGVQIDVRKVPSDSCENIEQILKKAKDGLKKIE